MIWLEENSSDKTSRCSPMTYTKKTKQKKKKKILSYEAGETAQLIKTLVIKSKEVD